jgi:capsular exopolysaccharide synthesis family protein
VTAEPEARRGKRAKSGPVLIADLDPRSVAAEAYRTLRANLEFIPSERGCRHIVITSPAMGEGKSTTAANLAVVAAQAGSRVCVVDADMRRPTLHTMFGVANRGGFTRALSQGVPLGSVAVATDVANLSLVVAGSSDGMRPAQLLNAPRLQKVLHDPTTPFDLVIFDTPPIISVADALNLAAHCDGVVVVVSAGAAPPSVLQQAVRQIEQVKGRVLGVVLNRVDLRRGDAEFYRYYRAYYATAKKD